MTNFSRSVLNIVASIPKGEVLTYKEVAIRAGSPHAFRSVGTILKKNTSRNIPCHRVIKSNGSVGSYNGLLQDSKKNILTREGVCFKK